MKTTTFSQTGYKGDADIGLSRCSAKIKSVNTTKTSFNLMAADFVACHCKNCDRNCCTSKNDWIEIDGNHYTCRDSQFFTDLGILPTGQRRSGAKGLQDSYSQSLVCAGCEEKLGFRCGLDSQEETHYRQVHCLSSVSSLERDCRPNSLTLSPRDGVNFFP